MKLSVLFVMLLTLQVSISAQTQPNFSGDWVLDYDRSDLGGSALIMRTKKVTQSSTELRVERVETQRVSATKTEAYSDSYTLRFGQVNTHILPGAPEPAKTGLKFHMLPGLTQLLVTAMIRDKVVLEEAWSISSDGTELYIRESFPLAGKWRDLYFYRKGSSPRPVTPAISGVWQLDPLRSKRTGGAPLPAIQMEVLHSWKRFAIALNAWFEATSPIKPSDNLLLDMKPGQTKEVSIAGEKREFSISNTGQELILWESRTSPKQTYSKTSFELIESSKTLKVTRKYFTTNRSEELYLTRK